MRALWGIVLLSLVIISHSARIPDENEYVQKLLQGLRDLETEQRRWMTALAGGEDEDQTADGTEADISGEEDGSKEVMENVSGQRTDISASQENTKEDATPAPKEPEEREDDELVPGSEFNAFFGRLPGIFGMLGGRGGRPNWWQGPNVCPEREEKEEKSEDVGGDFLIFGAAHFTACQNTPNKYICKTVAKRNGITKTTIVNYQCCNGFKVIGDSSKCTKVETKPLVELASEVGSDRFGDMIRSSGLEEKLEGNVTIFLPTDAALNDHTPISESLNSVDPVMTNEVSSPSKIPTDENDKNLILGHVVNGVLEKADFFDEQVLNTVDNRTLRVSVFPGKNGGLAVNCVKLNKTDLWTKNGVVHLVDSVLRPGDKQISDYLEQERFSKFKKALEENDVYHITTMDRAITVFAVENEGVEKISNSHKMCMRRILFHHILPHTLCSGMGGESGQKLATLDLGANWLPFQLEQGQMTIGNGTKILEKDLIARNGLVHVAENFAIPQSARLVSEVLAESGHEKWLNILEKSGLLNEIIQMANITMLVPTNEAVEEAGIEGKTPEELAEIVRYHIGVDQAGSHIKTMLDGSNMTVSTEKSMFNGLISGRSATINCVKLTRTGGRSCNGLLHEVPSLLRRPNGTVMEYIRSQPNLSILAEIINGTEIETQLETGFEGMPFTFLAPINEAFEKLPSEFLDDLKKDKEIANQLVSSHIMKDFICCNNIAEGGWPLTVAAPSLSGRPIELNRRRSDVVFGQGLRATKCDELVSNGVIHLVNNIRLGSKQPNREVVIRRPNSEIILAGL